jgi:hypothetical protein
MCIMWILSQQGRSDNQNKFAYALVIVISVVIMSLLSRCGANQGKLTSTPDIWSIRKGF